MHLRLKNYKKTIINYLTVIYMFYNGIKENKRREEDISA